MEMHFRSLYYRQYTQFVCEKTRKDVEDLVETKKEREGGI
jgi:hypothetical protein